MRHFKRVDGFTVNQAYEEVAERTHERLRHTFETSTILSQSPALQRVFRASQRRREDAAKARLAEVMSRPIAP